MIYFSNFNKNLLKFNKSLRNYSNKSIPCLPKCDFIPKDNNVNKSNELFD